MNLWDLLRRRIVVSRTWMFSWPDASKDLCGTCKVSRGAHQQKTHPFNEMEE